ncbi:hypothetical protein D3C85_842030 [compost metagenome]
MISEAEHKHIGRDAVAQQCGGDASGINELALALAYRIDNIAPQCLRRVLHIGVTCKGARHGFLRVGQDEGRTVARGRQGLAVARDNQVAAQHQVCATRRNADGFNRLGVRSEAQMTPH